MNHITDAGPRRGFRASSRVLEPLRSAFARYNSSDLYKNSLFIGAGRLVNAACGLIFWSIAAKYYSIGDVGIATVLISSLGLIMTISRMGFDVTLIRFMPLRDKSTVFSSCLLMTSLSSVAVSSIYLLMVGTLSPAISFIRDSSITFIALALMNSIALTTGNTFLSFKRGKYYLAQSLLGILRIPALIPFVIFGPMGIFVSYGFANISAALVAGLVINKIVEFEFKISGDFIKETYKFSTLNYVSDILFQIPVLILPLILLNVLSAEEEAKYFIAFSIGSIILLIPEAVGSAFFVEGSHGTNLRIASTKALTAIYALLIPAFLMIYLYGHVILTYFGKDYVESVELLRLYAFSSFFSAVYMIFVPILNVRMMADLYMKLNALRFTLILGLSYLLTLKLGLLGVGISWAIAHIILCLVIVALARKMEWISIRPSDKDRQGAG